MPDLDELDDNDPSLMAAAVGSVRPVRAEATPARPRPRPTPRSFHADESEALRSSHDAPFALPVAGEASQYRRDDVPALTLKRLRRGLYTVNDELDLHGLGAADAERLLRRFLQDALDNEHRCLRVITGKGLHSKQDEPVLRPMVEGLLRRRADVLAYSSAPQVQGGTGALLVLLARRR